MTRFFNRILRRRLVAGQTEKTEDREARRTHQRVVLRDQQVLQNSETREQANVLEGTRHLGLLGDLEVGQAFQQELVARLPVHRQHAARRLVEAGDAVEDRGLACTVRADDRRDIPTLHIEAQIVDGDETAKAHRKMLDLQDRVFFSVAQFGFIRRSARHSAYLRHQPCPSLVKAPDTIFFSCRKALGSRLPTKPRGFQTMTTTMARPKMSMR